MALRLSGHTTQIVIRDRQPKSEQSEWQVEAAAPGVERPYSANDLSAEEPHLARNRNDSSDFGSRSGGCLLIGSASRLLGKSGTKSHFSGFPTHIDLKRRLSPGN